MKTNISNQPKNNALRIVVIILISAVVLAGASYAYVNAFDGNLFGWKKEEPAQSNEMQNVNLDPATEEEIKTGNDIKKDSLDGSDSENTPDTGTVSISITAANQNGAKLQVRALIYDVVSTGECTLTLKNGSTAVVKKSNVQALSSSSACQGFDVPTSELSPGNWSIEVTYQGEKGKGVAQSSVTIN